MKVHDANFSNRPMLSAAKMYNSAGDIVFSNGAYWRRLRQICVNKLLSSKRVKSLTSVRHEEVHSMLKWLSTFSDKSPVKLVEKVSEMANHIVARAAFAGRCKRQEVLLKTLKEVIEQTSLMSPSDFFPWLSWLDMKMRTKLLRYYR